MGLRPPFLQHSTCHSLGQRCLPSRLHPGFHQLLGMEKDPGLLLCPAGCTSGLCGGPAMRFLTTLPVPLRRTGP